MTREELVQYATRGDAEAAEFLLRVMDLAHTWDDLVDRDKPVAEDAVNTAFKTALVWLPTNAFYLRHFPHLFPILANAVTNWQVANRMERARAWLDVSFIIRSDYINLVIEVARICGGHEWAEEAAYTLRQHWHAEGFDGYVTALEAEAAARGE